MSSSNLPEHWQVHLEHALNSDAMRGLRDFLKAEKASQQLIYPPMRDVFNAFQHLRLEQVRVLILGQDPYPGANQAHGLSFSVRPGIAIPRSLQNIYRELRDDVDARPVRHGCLLPWAQQGVLLLNAVLTVRAGAPDSHKNRGWEVFTDAVVELISQQTKNVVFMLWGRNAQIKAERVDAAKHLLLKAAHPSPMSADRGFFGCRHFSKANAYLLEHRGHAINWQLPDQVEMTD
jgi:uracil-DNA glycosylase